MIEKIDELDWIMNFFNNSSDLKSEGIDRVRNFSLLWNLFEKYACKKNANVDSISKAVNNISAKETITPELITRHIDYFSTRYLNQDKSANIIFEKLKFRSNHSDQDIKQKIIATLRKSELDPNENLKALLFILYRFRNNLFHGEKNVIKLYEQVENFIVANDLLTKVLTIMKNNNLIIDD